MMIRVLILLMLGAGPAILLGQHQEVCEPPVAYKGKEQPAKDTVSILSAFKKGHVNGHFRYFLMATDNAPGLTDYAAHAAGGGIRFETASFHGFHFTVGGSYIFNLGSPDFTAPDSLTGAFNRYEVGLYDIADPAVTRDLDRLEELYLQYVWKKSGLTFGRQLINTPFINLQDGRMRPTAVEGAVLRWNDLPSLKVESGFLYAVSPRSTVNWYSIGNSFGLYPSGVNPDGSKSDYQGVVKTAGVGYAGLSGKVRENFTVHLWELWVDRVMNTTLLQADFAVKNQHRNTLTLSGQVIRQDGLGKAPGPDQAQPYFPASGQSMTFGMSAGYQTERLSASLNYNRITGDGRYLMPREWGRDPFFTFMPRERNEGLGDVHAIVMKWAYKNPESGYSIAFAAGYFDLPDVKETRLNKYGMPSYAQFNLDVRYRFKGLLEGLDVQYLLATKIHTGETYGNDRFVINKVDMRLHNLVLNFHF